MAQQVIQFFNYSIAITPSDTVDSPLKNNRPPDAFWIGGAGIVAVVHDDGSIVNHTVTAGQFFPYKCRRLNAATTATLIVGWWQL